MQVTSKISPSSKVVELTYQGDVLALEWIDEASRFSLLSRDALRSSPYTPLMLTIMPEPFYQDMPHRKEVDAVTKAFIQKALQVNIFKNICQLRLTF